MTETAPEQVKLYWRPGCPFCMSLQSSLRRLGVQVTPINIWEDDRAAATVRQHAGGNETVPTVVIGEVAMVNPSGREVLEVARRLAPDSIVETDTEAESTWSVIGRRLEQMLRTTERDS